MKTGLKQDFSLADMARHLNFFYKNSLIPGVMNRHIYNIFDDEDEPTYMKDYIKAILQGGKKTYTQFYYYDRNQQMHIFTEKELTTHFLACFKRSQALVWEGWDD